MPRGKHKLLPPATGNRGPRWTPLDRRFVAEYLVDQCATKAMIRAGGAAKSAYTHGPKMLRKPHVRAAVDEELRKIKAELHDQALAVQQVVYAGALADPGEAFDALDEPLPLSKMSRDVRRSIASIRVEYETRQVVDEFGQPVVANDTGKPVTVRVAKVAELKWRDPRPDRELALKLAGELKDVVKHEGLSHEEIIREVERRAREAAGARAK